MTGKEFINSVANGKLDIIQNLLDVLKVEPRRQESVAPPHSSPGEIRRSISTFAPKGATADYPQRIHPRTGVWGLLRRRVKNVKTL